VIKPGSALGHYEILSVLGKGGMGEVYRAKDKKLGREVAIKVLAEGFGQDPVGVARFEREARAAAALNHPNICAIHEIGEHDGQPFLVMELISRAAATWSLDDQRVLFVPGGVWGGDVSELASAPGEFGS
jgi:serine/threonine protein kinase